MSPFMLNLPEQLLEGIAGLFEHPAGGGVGG
jgi:hypothetical protein